MKRILYLAAVATLCVACNQTAKEAVIVTVTNPAELARTGEMAEVPMSEVERLLNLADTAQLVVLNAEGKQVPYQITYDEKLIFPVAVEANGSSNYTLKAGTPEEFDTKACGKHYPQRVDDVAWENDLVAFRTYGPALQAKGEKAYGYDVWTKYNTTDPVVEARYESELNLETQERIAELRKTDAKAADALYRSVSYHVDHGNGLDCYKVGPTLGGGTAALLVDGRLVYPYCYRTEEILDNGPLRFSVRLTYHPLVVKGDSNVVETRLIQLDAGSHLNRTVVSYANLSAATPVATGLVLHEADGQVTTDATDGYIAYADPTDNPSGGNGKIFVGAAFPNLVDSAVVQLFDAAEAGERGAGGHVLAISEYQPDSHYTYYWGSAWSKADIQSFEAWNSYLADFAKKIRLPMTVTLQ